MMFIYMDLDSGHIPQNIQMPFVFRYHSIAVVARRVDSSNFTIKTERYDGSGLLCCVFVCVSGRFQLLSFTWQSSRLHTFLSHLPHSGRMHEKCMNPILFAFIRSFLRFKFQKYGISKPDTNRPALFFFFSSFYSRVIKY